MGNRIFDTFYVKHWNGDGYNRQYTNPDTGYVFASRDEAEEWAMNNTSDFVVYSKEDEEYVDYSSEYE